MYIQFFKLNQAPFSIAPDPRYLYMSERHREALAHLLYGVNSGGGFVLLTGEIGAGKTTVCRCFLEQIPPNCNVAYIFNPKLTVNELLKSICNEFGIRFDEEEARKATVKYYVDRLNEYLLAAHAEGQNNVLIIDEAQNLSAEVLEQLRLLTNLETSERKLLQIILIGQPELRDMLAKPELEQLAQRVIARYHLGSLSADESASYIQHRLAVSGASGNALFPPAAQQMIHQIAKGIPRRINLLCDRALLGAYAENKPGVDRAIVKKAASEIFDQERSAAGKVPNPWRYPLLGATAGAAVAGLVFWGIATGTINARILGGKPALATVPNSAPKAVAAAASISNQTPQRVETSGAASSASAPAQILQSAAAQPAPITIDPELKVNEEARNRNNAFQQLAQFWKVTLPDGEPCQAALKVDLRCYKSASGLSEIRQLDRPALLALQDADNKPYFAVLTGLNNANATLRIGGATQTVSLITLGRHIRSDFTTFWRVPQAYREHVGNGDRGPEVDWLAQQLTKINGLKEPLPSQVFGPAMARLVREFQGAQGLRMDGVAGPQTFMHFNRAAGVEEPHLQASPAAAAQGK